MKLPKNIAALKPYTSARDLLNEHIKVFLDANENPYPTSLNRYPDPAARELTAALSDIKGIPQENMLLTNGSDEGIDLLLKAFCKPGEDNVVTPSPTYGIYEVRAQVNDTFVLKVPLGRDFDLDVDHLISSIQSNTKLVFLCSPNNPTGNILQLDDITSLCKHFQGLVVLDEAYVDFSSTKSLWGLISEYPNLVVLQTLSKAWGMASARLGVTIASEDIIQLLMGVKLPYNLSGPLQKMVLQKLKNTDVLNRNVQRLVAAREKISQALNRIHQVKHVYPSEANFILVEFEDAENIYNRLVEKGIRIRNFSKRIPGCLRISIGTAKENALLLKELRNI